MLEKVFPSICDFDTNPYWAKRWSWRINRKVTNKDLENIGEFPLLESLGYL